MAVIQGEFQSGGPPQEIEFDPRKAPFQHDGEPGSILDVLLAHGVVLENACGGSCACTTCHVVVTDGIAHLSEAEEEEEDMLDRAPGLTPTSRLGCQAIVQDPSARILVRIPRHTVYLVSGHGG